MVVRYFTLLRLRTMRRALETTLLEQGWPATIILLAIFIVVRCNLLPSVQFQSRATHQDFTTFITELVLRVFLSCAPIVLVPFNAWSSAFIETRFNVSCPTAVPYAPHHFRVQASSGPIGISIVTSVVFSQYIPIGFPLLKLTHQIVNSLGFYF